MADDIRIKTKEESAAIQKELEQNWQITKDFFGNISKCFPMIQSNLLPQVKIGDKMFQFGKEPTPPPYKFNVGENTFRKITKQEACNMVLEHFGDRKLFQPKPVRPQTPYYPKGDTLEVPNIDIEAPSLPPKPVMLDLGINITSIMVNNPQLEVPEFIQGSSNIQACIESSDKINIADVVPLDKKDSQGKNGGKNLNTGDFDKEDWDENYNDYIINKVDYYDWYDLIDLKSSITNKLLETNIDSKQSLLDEQFLSNSVNSNIVQCMMARISDKNIVSVEPQTIEWALDTAATNHITPFKSDFLELNEIPTGPKQIIGVTGSDVITHQGTVIIRHTNSLGETHTVKLYPVFYWPKANHRLLAGNKYIVNGYDIKYLFPETSIIMKANGKLFMSLFAKPERDGYTYLHASSVKQNKAVTILAFKIKSTDPVIAHNRFGHIPY
ncbi:hypothetical protein WG66_003216 [Moniliophthora roreri]|nr:hypothetical protein WG66_003216 [Moniliophthora roreri]